MKSRQGICYYFVRVVCSCKVPRDNICYEFALKIKVELEVRRSFRCVTCMAAVLQVDVQQDVAVAAAEQQQRHHVQRQEVEHVVCCFLPAPLEAAVRGALSEVSEVGPDDPEQQQLQDRTESQTRCWFCPGCSRTCSWGTSGPDQNQLPGPNGNSCWMSRGDSWAHPCCKVKLVSVMG